MTLQTAGAIAELGPWFHNLHLPDGRQTAPDHPLGDFPAFKWRQIADCLPADMSGARALDIGCNAGFYSFELAARGAEVLAIDTDERYLRQARWAAGQLDSDRRVRFLQMSVYELARRHDTFDLVLFLGVIYHLRHPLLALDIVAERLDGRLVLQTLTMPGAAGQAAPPEDLGIDDRPRLLEDGWPRAAFLEHRLAGDPTNWWAPDDACVRAMARSAGLRVLATPGHEIYICERSREEDELTRALRRAELQAASGCGICLGSASTEPVGNELTAAGPDGGAKPRRRSERPAPDGGRSSLEVARVVPLEQVDAALRLLHLDLLRRGASAQQLGAWLWGMHWFPHLNYHETILALADALPEQWRTGTLCDPQILLQFPHTGPEPEISFHRDKEPEWAGDRRYLRIVGVPLSPWRRENGGLLVQAGDGDQEVKADPGDAICMGPDLLHTGGINRTGTVRYGIYFRWIEDASEAA